MTRPKTLSDTQQEILRLENLIAQAKTWEAQLQVKLEDAKKRLEDERTSKDKTA